MKLSLAELGRVSFHDATLLSVEERPGFIRMEIDTACVSSRLIGAEGESWTLWECSLQCFNVVTSEKVEWVIHMGANSSTTEKNWEHLLEVNTHYTQRIFEWCAKNKKSLIYASSAATYGAGEWGYDDETDAEKLKPLNLYGDSKVQFDRWAVKQSVRPPHWYGLKFFNVYGPGEAHKGPMSSVAYKAFFQIRDKGDQQLFKSYKSEYRDGEQMRDFIYVKEVTAWMWELTRKKPASGVYNMGTGRARTWVDLARAVFAAFQKPEKIQFIEMPESLRDQYQYFTEAKMQKWARNGMTPSRWSLEEGVRDYVQNHLLKG